MDKKKFRVRDIKTNEIIGYEWYEDNKWWFCDTPNNQQMVNSQDARFVLLVDDDLITNLILDELELTKEK